MRPAPRAVPIGKGARSSSLVVPALVPSYRYAADNRTIRDRSQYCGRVCVEPDPHVELTHTRDRQRCKPSARLDAHWRELRRSHSRTHRSRHALGCNARRILVYRRVRPRSVWRRESPLPLAVYGIDSKCSICNAMGDHGSARTRPHECRVTAACAQPRYARLHTVANEETSNPESMAGESADVEHVNSPTAGVSIHGLENQ